MGFTTVLFDLDHTLLDSDESERLAFEETMRSVGVGEPSDHLATYQEINVGLWKQVEASELSPNDVKWLRFERLLAALEVDADPIETSETYASALGTHGQLYAGARELLEQLGQRAALGLITNGIGEVQRARIERLQLNTHFSAIAISGELGISKPDPAIFDVILADLGSPTASDAIIVGDSLTSDIAGGLNAGIATCWYNRSGGTSGNVNPTFEVTSLDQIVPAIGL
ncbi:MAG: YjjG family noncanonical pyrimidine nucleotidase [Acidimicrobiia bacterium]|nr:YjjG family noncanonical pyrimidine nucleotidase [Acidimicrobiia bacterium]